MKQNLLLLHGALGTKKQFSELKTYLDAHFEVHAFDFAGHGSRPFSATYSIDLFTENAVNYLASNGIVKTHIFGYSMGGYVALQLARKRPDLVAKIMTLGTKFAWTPASAAQEIKMLNPAKIAEKVPAFAQQLAAKHTANDWKEVMRRTADLMIALGADKKLGHEELTQIKKEVYIGIGSEDRMVSLEESQEAATLLPNGHLVVMDGFKHPIDRIDHLVLAEYLKKNLD